MLMRTLTTLTALCLLLPACDIQAPRTIDLAGVDPDRADQCDELVASHCLYPFPNNHFTVPDPVSATGLRIQLQEQVMPVANPVSVPASSLAPAGVETLGQRAVDPAEWNRNDGFSPGAMLLAHLPGIDLAESRAPRLSDLSTALDEHAGMVVINADTGERHLIWAELDANASTVDGQALIIRPARNFEEGQRYIAAIRGARDGFGQLLPVNPLFAAYRDGTNTGIEVLELRRPAMEDIFDRLGRAGIERDELTLAWDFTIASQQSLTGRLLAIRDDAFARLDGGAPRFTVDQLGIEIDGAPREGLSRGISGTFEVPNYLDQPGGVPGSRFHYDSDAADAVPTVRDGNDVFTARFRCQVPESTVADFDDPDSTVTPARAALYGHGLFGEGPGGEFRAGNVRAMQNEHNILFCATDWYGMATEDFMAGVMHNILADIGQFPRQVDRSQQGLLAQMFLAELLRHPEGFASHPAFRHGPDDSLLFDPSEVFYDGNSQGGILGGALVATAPNIHRGVLGVPGSNYSLLLRRYGPFAERFGFILYEAYRDELDRSLVFALMQMLWDRAENNGYLSHLAGRHLPDTPTEKAVLLHVALGDYQVTHWSAEIMARTIGAAIHEPTVRLGEHTDTNPYYDIPLIDYPHDGHAIMIWDSGDVDPETGRGNPLPPTNNTGPDPAYGNDPHSSPRSTVAARLQKSEFMRSNGQVIDVCGGNPCFSDDYTGIGRATGGRDLYSRLGLEEITIDDLQRGYEQGDFTTRQVVEAYLARIQAIDVEGPALNAVRAINPDALADAEALDSERAAGQLRGPLHGVPVLLKDNIDVAGMPTTAGSRFMANAMPLQDAFIVERLREQGAVILGKTNLSEWANFHSNMSSSGWSGLGGQVQNPYDVTRNPCGSSSGSGVAASANLSALTIGTETNGSIVCPANANGVVGLKPTVGLWSRSGIIPISHTTDSAGPMVRTVRDAAVLLGALAGEDARDTMTDGSSQHSHADYTVFLGGGDLQGRRLGLLTTSLSANFRVTALVRETVALLESLGATVVEIDRISETNINQEAFQVLMYEFRDGLNRYFASLGPDAPVRSVEHLAELTREDPEETAVWDRNLLFNAADTGDLDSDEYRSALERMLRYSREQGIDRVIAEHELDAIIAPTGSPAWKTDLVLGDNFSISSSSPSARAGYPVISLPVGTIDGLPVGLSIFAGAWSEPVLLELAHALEQALPPRAVPQLIE